ncbi:uncharacterized protein LOC105763093 [Gossypium raimondii]|uniref:uncharacterized protein LOC105763093 n=1 Tax=Gossypium raimondii TaxID=29730 RepID=UPI00063AD6CA|nr:uncharacterized protein LOC105763093 [Gossypium raimondii]
MDAEMDFMKSNTMWELVNLPVGIKPIGCKWIYKKKRNAEGKVETHKARLVGKDYTQKEGIDYDETFSPAAMLQSICILLSIFIALDYEIWQMNVKTTFLNGYLDETIYIVSPTDYVVKGKKEKILKKFCKENFKSASTPIALGEKLTSKGDSERVNENNFRSLIGCLLYLTTRRSDIMFAVSLLSRFMHCCNVTHFKTTKKVLRYIKGTLSYGIKFVKTEKLKLVGYIDSDWARTIEDIKNTLSYFFTLDSTVFVGARRSKNQWHIQQLKLSDGASGGADMTLAAAA